jgi:DNA-binding Lrp family transcriptional regulator
VPAFDQHVGGHHHLPARDRQHGGVVARAENHPGSLWESGGDGVDQGEFPYIGDTVRHVRSSLVATEGRLAQKPSFRMETRRPAAGAHSTSAGGQLVVVQAYILIQTEVGKAADVARQISEIEGVTLAEDVTGPYDVIVRAEADNVDDLGKLVVARVQGVDGITRTLTCPVVHL